MQRAGRRAFDMCPNKPFQHMSLNQQIYINLFKQKWWARSCSLLSYQLTRTLAYLPTLEIHTSLWRVTYFDMCTRTPWITINPYAFIQTNGSVEGSRKHGKRRENFQRLMLAQCTLPEGLVDWHNRAMEHRVWSILSDLRFGPNTSQEIKKVDPIVYAPSPRSSATHQYNKCLSGIEIRSRWQGSWRAKLAPLLFQQEHFQEGHKMQPEMAMR